MILTQDIIRFPIFEYSKTTTQTRKEVSTIKAYKRLNEKEFVQIKALLKAGIGLGKVAKVTKRSWNVVKAVGLAESFSGYHNILRKTYPGSYASKTKNVRPVKSTVEGLLSTLIKEVKSLREEWNVRPR